MRKIRKGDEVIVIAGRDKGKTGRVSKVLTDVDHLFVEGVNLKKKHVKPNPQINEDGGIKEIEAPLHVSNVAILNPTTNKADRVGVKCVDGRKVRVFKSNDERIDS